MKKLVIIIFCLIMISGCTDPVTTVEDRRKVVEKILIYAGKIEKIDYISISHNYISLVIYFDDGRAIPLQTDGKFLVPAFKNKIMDLYEVHSWTDIYRGGKFSHRNSYEFIYTLEYDS